MELTHGFRRPFPSGTHSALSALDAVEGGVAPAALPHGQTRPNRQPRGFTVARHVPLVHEERPVARDGSQVVFLPHLLRGQPVDRPAFTTSHVEHAALRSHTGMEARVDMLDAVNRIPNSLSLAPDPTIAQGLFTRGGVASG